jgi:hypothetical protein
MQQAPSRMDPARARTAVTPTAPGSLAQQDLQRKASHSHSHPSTLSWIQTLSEYTAAQTSCARPQSCLRSCLALSQLDSSPTSRPQAT